MDAIAALFSRFDALPCAFTLHTPSGVTRLGQGEPAFALHVRNGAGTRALTSLDELSIAEAYVRGDLEIEGDAVKAMWFRNLLSDSRWWIKTWRRLQPLLVSRKRLNPGWIAKHYDSNNLQLYATDREFRAYTPGLYESDDDTLEEGTREKYDFAFDDPRLGCGEAGGRRGGHRRPRLGRVAAVLPRPRRARAGDHAVAPPARVRREADRRARARRQGAVPGLLHLPAQAALQGDLDDGRHRGPLRLPAGALVPARAARAGRPRLPRLRGLHGAGGHLELHHQVRLAGLLPRGLHARADGRHRPLADRARRHLGRPPHLPPVGEEGADRKSTRLNSS